METCLNHDLVDVQSHPDGNCIYLPGDWKAMRSETIRMRAVLCGEDKLFVSTTDLHPEFVKVIEVWNGRKWLCVRKLKLDSQLSIVFD